ncbi:HET domain-containing protein [Fusarium proliferatum]|nr:HET domain-containing protein [Fusarium proliferatum]
MRLLTVANDGELRLADFVGDYIPPYSILSHTWGKDSEEVTFQDMVEGKGKNKPGYQKLRFCEKQSENDNIQFFWIDTCCIDKTSSAELSEAINSMYHWYRDADKCYVYLSDVSINGSVGSSLFPQQTWETAFRESRWFTRGWTLQELVAPSCVEFYSLEGERLGDRASMIQEIEDITGINTEALQGSPLSRFGFEERMSWARGRETKLTTATHYDFALADWDGDKVLDLVVIKKGSTDTKTTEVYILSGASNFQDIILQTGTALHETDDTWAFSMGRWNAGRKPDLFAIKKSSTGTNSTEVHVLSGASGFQKFILQTGTCLYETDDAFDFAVADWNADGCPDLVVVWKSNDSSRHSLLHVLSGASTYQDFMLHAEIPLLDTLGMYEFMVTEWTRNGRLDLVGIRKSEIGTNSTEVHIMTGL